MSNSRARAILALMGICLGLPLLGAWLLGMSWVGFWTLPLKTRAMGYVPFSLVLNVAYWLFVLVLALWWWHGHQKAPSKEAPVYPRLSRFPWWGWVSLMSLIAFWILAWTRFEWFARFQAFTFTPIWLSFIVLLNAAIQARSGSCPMKEKPGRFLMLFGLSAVFWWGFEYFNRFVHNWLYHGVEDWSATAYATHATLAFSTVLPAVYSMARLLETFPRLQAFFSRGPQLAHWLTSKCSARLVLSLTILGFFFIGKYPQICFPLLWGGPVLAWLCLSRLFELPLDLGNVSQGDWRWLLTWALAGLLCGFCWECWNLYSLAKWTYQIPWFETAYVFEMPLAGYLGYLPFGLECGLVIAAMTNQTFKKQEL